MQVTMSNHKSTKSALKNLEIQVGQLAKQLAEKSSNNFGANIEKNPKEECKVVVTRSRKLMVAEDKDVVALKEHAPLKDTTIKKKNEVTDAMSQRGEKQIMVEERKIKDQENEIEVGKEKEKEEKEKVKKNKDEEKSRNEKEREKRKEKASDKGMEVPYPMVPSKKDKDRHLARFLDIFRKLEITMPFGEALQ